MGVEQCGTQTSITNIKLHRVQAGLPIINGQDIRHTISVNVMESHQHWPPAANMLSESLQSFTFQQFPTPSPFYPHHTHKPSIYPSSIALLISIYQSVQHFIFSSIFVAASSAGGWVMLSQPSVVWLHKLVLVHHLPSPVCFDVFTPLTCLKMEAHCHALLISQYMYMHREVAQQSELN